METFFKTKYLGLSQLLAVPLTSSKPRVPLAELPDAGNCDKQPGRYRVGFVPFKLP